MFNVKVAYTIRPATEPKALSSNSLDLSHNPRKSIPCPSWKQEMD